LSESEFTEFENFQNNGGIVSVLVGSVSTIGTITFYGRFGSVSIIGTITFYGRFGSVSIIGTITFYGRFGSVSTIGMIIVIIGLNQNLQNETENELLKLKYQVIVAVILKILKFCQF